MTALCSNIAPSIFISLLVPVPFFQALTYFTDKPLNPLLIKHRVQDFRKYQSADNN